MFLGREQLSGVLEWRSGLVRVNVQEWPLEIKARPVETFTDESHKQPLVREVLE